MILTGYSLYNFDHYISDNSDNKGITDESMRTYKKNKIRGTEIVSELMMTLKIFYLK